MAEIIKLDAQELVKLTECEEIIEQGLDTTQQVVSALMTIKEQKLYRQDHKTWEAYCSSRWGFGANYASKLINAERVREIVPVANERQARELAQFSDEEKVEIWEEAKEKAGGEDKITAKILSEAAGKIKKKGSDFADPAPLAKLLGLLRSAEDLYSTEHEDAIFIGFNHDAWRMSLTGMRAMLHNQMPEATCDQCGGRGCPACNNRGWLTAGECRTLGISSRSESDD